MQSAFVDQLFKYLVVYYLYLQRLLLIWRGCFAPELTGSESEHQKGSLKMSQ